MINQYLPNTTLTKNLDIEPLPGTTTPTKETKGSNSIKSKFSKGFLSKTTMLDAIRKQRNQQYIKSSKTPPVTGSFEFATNEWSLHATRTVSLFSPVFRIGEYSDTLWCLEVLPTGGRAPDPSNNVAIVVHNKSPHAQTAIVSVQLCQYETPSSVRGEPAFLGIEESARITSNRHRYAAAGAPNDASKWKLQNFIPTSVVSNPKYGFIQNDTAIFKVSITAIPDDNGTKSMQSVPTTITSPSTLAAASPLYHDTVFIPVARTLATDMIPLLVSSETKATGLYSIGAPDPYSDVIITSSEKHSTIKYYCHKAILAARSRTLHKKFQDPLFTMKYLLNKPLGCYPVDVPEGLLGHFLSYLYSDRMDEAILSEHSLSLLVPAAKYEIPLLVQNCTQKLIHNLSVETVPQILQAAVIADNQLLRKSCIAFVASHLSEVVVTEDWKRLAVDTSILQDVLDQSLDPHCTRCREERSTILQWINNQKHTQVAASYGAALQRLTNEYVSGDGVGVGATPTKEGDITILSPEFTPEKLTEQTVETGTAVAAGTDTATTGVGAGSGLRIDTSEEPRSWSSSDSSGGSNFSHERGRLFSCEDREDSPPRTPEQRPRSATTTQMLLLPSKQRSRAEDALSLTRHPAQSPLPVHSSSSEQSRLRSQSAPMQKQLQTGTDNEDDADTEGNADACGSKGDRKGCSGSVLATTGADTSAGAGTTITTATATAVPAGAQKNRRRDTDNQHQKHQKHQKHQQEQEGLVARLEQAAREERDREPRHSCSANAAQAPYTRVWTHWSTGE